MTDLLGWLGWDVTAPSEGERLQALRRYAVLDTPAEGVFDGLARAAAAVAGVPTALVSLVDEDRQWFKARIGIDVCSTSREISLCTHVVEQREALIVPDLTADERFANNPVVIGDPFVRFYAGVPLRTPDAHVIGTLCVIDYQPGRLDSYQLAALEALASQVMVQLELRAALGPVPSGGTVVAPAPDRPVGKQMVDDMSEVVVSRHTPDSVTTYVSPSVLEILGANPALLIGRRGPSEVHPLDRSSYGAAMQNANLGHPVVVTTRVRHADGGWRRFEIQLTPHLDHNGRVDEIAAVSLDITARVDVAMSVLAGDEDETGAEAAQVHDAVAIAMVSCDAEGRLTYFNASALGFHGIGADAGLDPASWAGRYALHGPQGRLLGSEEIPLVRALRGYGVDGDLLVIARPGVPERIVRCFGRRLQDAHGGTLGAMVAMTDVTASQRAQEGLAEANTQLRNAVGRLGRTATLAIATDPGRVDGRMMVAWSDRSPGELADVTAEQLGGVRVGPVLTGVFAPAILQTIAAGGVVEEARRMIGSGDMTTVPWSGDGLVIDLRDDGNREAVGQALAIADQRLEYLQKLSSVVSWSLDVGSGVLTWSAEAWSFLGGDPTDRPSVSYIIERVHPEDRAAFETAHASLLEDHQPIVLEVRILREDGEQRWVRVRSTVVVDEVAGTVTRLDSCMQDTTAERATEERFATRAMRDPLTGLCNRRGWEALAPMMVAAADGAGRSVAVGLIDLDGFRSVNERSGFDGGDRILVKAATAWNIIMRPGDLVARVGADEFALLLVSEEGEDATEVVEGLRRRAPGGAASAGVAPVLRSDVDGALARATRAQQRAHRAGGVRTLAAG